VRTVARRKLRPFYSITDLALLLGWSRARTRLFLKHKDVPSQRVGSRVYFKLSDLMRCLDDAAFWGMKEAGK
jgi:hypothetical protein